MSKLSTRLIAAFAPITSCVAVLVVGLPQWLGSRPTQASFAPTSPDSAGRTGDPVLCARSWEEPEALLGLPFVLSSRKLNGIHYSLQMLAGAWSIAFGVWYAYGTGIASGPMKSLTTV